MNKYLEKCFDLTQINKISYLRQYLELINRNKKNPPIEEYTERHHIVPRGWFRRNKIEIDNSEENVIRLNVKDHLKAHLLLFYYFREVKDFEMYQSSLGVMHVMTSQSKSQLQKCIQEYGDFPKEVYDELQRIRTEAYKERRKYSQEYIEKCFKIYSLYDNPNQGIEEVLKQTGFKYSNRRTLMVQFKKYIDKERYEDIKRRNIEWSQKDGYLIRKYGSIEKYEEYQKKVLDEKKLQIENKRKENIIEYERKKDKYYKLLQMYKKYGSEYIHEVLNCTTSINFLKKCREFGFDIQDKNSNGNSFQIDIDGQVHGLVEWCKILNITPTEYMMMTRIHKKANVEYATIFSYWKDGILKEKYKEIRDLHKKDQKPIRYNRMLYMVSRLINQPYYQICDLYELGKKPEQIIFELTGQNILSEELSQDIEITRLPCSKEFWICFKNKRSSILRDIINIFEKNSSFRPDIEKIERLKIIPIALLRKNNITLESKNNEIYLTPEDSLRVKILFYKYFLSEGDEEMMNFQLSRIRKSSEDVANLVSNCDNYAQLKTEHLLRSSFIDLFSTSK